jgi:hypothetical protein
MPSYKDDRNFEKRMTPHVRRAIGEWLTVPASMIEDQRHATDFFGGCTILANGNRIASRVRRNKFAKHPMLDQFTIRYTRPFSGAETEHSKILAGWGDYFFYAFANIRERALMLWWIGYLDIFRDTNPDPYETHLNDDENPSELAVFRLKDLPPSFVVHRGHAPAVIYDSRECELCDRTGVLPSGLACDHTDHDGQRLNWIRHNQVKYPACSVCRAPMVVPAIQKLGHHLSCDPSAGGAR